MYTVCIEGPKVEWSTVPGSQSVGYDIINPAEMAKFTFQLREQLRNVGLIGYFVVVKQDGKEIDRMEVCGEDRKDN